MSSSNEKSLIPKVQSFRLGLFKAFTDWFVRRSFHSVRIVTTPPVPQEFSQGGGVVLYSNHPSWWDPLIGIFLINRYFHRTRAYAPIDAAMLDQYKFFRHLGFYGVDRKSPSSIRKFIRVSRAILNQPDSIIWVTPQGKFADVRDRSAALEMGLTRLRKDDGPTHFVPVAIEYVFWSERLPEVLVHFGKPVEAAAHSNDHSCLHSRLSWALESTQNELAERTISRDPSAFSQSFSSEPGFFFLYDLWRRIKSPVTNTPTIRSHNSHNSHK